MNTQSESNQLMLPALRAYMGDWIYYISFMKMRDIANKISKLQLMYSSERLQELIQRQLAKGRTKEISEYLLTQQQRFFNALVIGTYGGDPKWTELLVKERFSDVSALPEDIEGIFGFLILDGSEKLFPIDGQHRIEGIRSAISQNPELENEEVSVIFVKGLTADRRAEDPEGFERTRRLFTTLNKYGKRVSKKDIIALDEDDSMAIITRKLVEDYSLFTGDKTSIKAATSLPRSDGTSFTSINSLYDGLNIFFKSGTNRSWNNFKKFYPGEPTITDLYRRSVELWDYFCEFFSPLSEIANSDSGESITPQYRNRMGGHLLFRPIGLLMSLKAVRNLMDKVQISIEESVERVSHAEMFLSKSPWAHLIWNPLNQKMITASSNRKAAEKALVYSVGGDLSIYNTDRQLLAQEIAAIQGKEPDEIVLPLSYP